MKFQDLDNIHVPRQIPIFPLPGVILLPGTAIPLNIFEPRYVQMIENVLENDNYMGMIQPRILEEENILDDESKLYGIGCLGEVIESKKRKDNTYFIKVAGLCRFQVQREIASDKLYRNILATYDPFLEDFQEQKTRVDRKPLLTYLERTLRNSKFRETIEKLSPLSDQVLINAMCLSLQFSPPEKQALLEAQDLETRTESLLNLLRMGFNVLENEDSTPPFLI